MSILSAGAISRGRLGRIGGIKIAPIEGVNASEIVSLSAGWFHTVAVLSNGKVKCWGDNSEYQIGCKTPKMIPIPRDHDGFEEGDEIVWSSCGDKTSIFLDNKGQLIWARATNRPYGMKRIKGEQPFVYVAAGAQDDAMVIDTDGRLHMWTVTDAIQRSVSFALPEQVYDVGMGKDVAIALGVSGMCYVLKKVDGKMGEPVLVKELGNCPVLRVFARAGQMMALTKNWNVFAWGQIQEERNFEEFTLVSELKDQQIIDIGIGDTYALYVTMEGKVYGSGSNGDGVLMIGDNCIGQSMLPTKSEELDSINVAKVVCGCYHSLVLSGKTIIGHPGIKSFKKMIGVHKFKLHGPEDLFMRGFLQGDIVSVELENGSEDGWIVGMGDNELWVNIDNELKYVEPGKVEFLSRKGFIGIQLQLNDRELLLDGGEFLERCFGLQSGDLIRKSDGDTQFEVLGIEKGQIWLKNMETGVVDVSPDNIRSFFSRYTVVKSRKQLESMVIEDVTYPVERVERHKIVLGSVIDIVGRFGNFYIGEVLTSLNNRKAFFLKRSSYRPSEKTRGFRQYDRVVYDGTFGSIISVTDETSLFLSDEALADGASPILVETSKLSMVATLANNAYITVDGRRYNVGINDHKATEFLPGDLIYGCDRWARVIGYDGDKLFAVDYTDQLFELKEADPYTLIRRDIALSSKQRRIRCGNDYIEISTFSNKLCGTGCIQGDQVIFRGQIQCRVCGTGSGGYIWLITEDGTALYCVLPEDASSLIAFNARPMPGLEFYSRAQS